MVNFNYMGKGGDGDHHQQGKQDCPWFKHLFTLKIKVNRPAKV